jgi:hypothetical protein
MLTRLPLLSTQKKQQGHRESPRHPNRKANQFSQSSQENGRLSFFLPGLLPFAYLSQANP